MVSDSIGWLVLDGSHDRHTTFVWPIYVPVYVIVVELFNIFQKKT